MSKLKVAVIVGSNRRKWINRKLAEAHWTLAGGRIDARFIRIDDLPIYNADLETERPANVHRLKKEVADTEAVLVVMPEHNRSLPAVLKNAIDWGSKPMASNVWKGKIAAITGTSPGAIGTAVGQQHLRQIMGILGAMVVGGEAYISFKPDLIDEGGEIANETTRAFLQQYVDNFLSVAMKLTAPNVTDGDNQAKRAA